MRNLGLKNIFYQIFFMFLAMQTIQEILKMVR